MGTIAIVANPYSGKDIRRLTTHATVIDNNEKANIVCRIIEGVLAIEPHEIVLMPDRDRLGKKAIGLLKSQEALQYVRVHDMPITGTQQDTVRFVADMAGADADVVVVLGGDGTCRAAAKTIGDVPMIPVSTGTNNVYPSMQEGTSVALAAAAIAGGVVGREAWGPRDKRIEITVEGKEGTRQDMALVDAVLSSRAYVGARALLHREEIHSVLAVKCHPANIGFSALAGCVRIISPEQDAGLYLELCWDRDQYFAAISAGELVRFGVTDSRLLELGEPLEITPGFEGTVAVDGERELVFGAEDRITMSITREGPYRAHVPAVLEDASQKGFFGPRE